MVKIYSSQETPDVVPNVNNIITTETDWWAIYDANTNEIIIPPQQCGGETSSPYTMVIADTEEELNQYIADNGLTLPIEEFETTYNIE
jgi:hypothetical protein